jgi:cellulose synthase/poly-beta-1,6-N-acetylglucosamine synthase-like glycosyltransferase
MFGRVVGLLVTGIAVLGLSLLWWTVATTDSTLTSPPDEVGILNGISFTYSWQAPPLFAEVASVILAFIVVLVFVGLELRDINQSRRSHSAASKPLAPWVIMDATRGVFYGEVTVTVLIPAHNEEDVLGDTLDELFQQSRLPDRVIVLADNCTDGTINLARERGIEVRESSNNIHAKAGALNQALAVLMHEGGPNDTFMILDADTRLKQGFIETAVKRFSSDRGLSAIGGLFFGEPGHGLLGQLQRNEYNRYARDIKRRRGRVFVLTGTASIFRAPALKVLAASRGTLVPGVRGDVYDTAALTEDNEITIALKSLGALMTSPAECQVETELMTSWRTLWRQRLRWQRGALENISAYGLTPATSRYWSQQVGIAYSVVALWSFFMLIFLQLVSTDTWIWYPFWLLMGAVFIVERVVSVWRGGWVARFIAATLVLELLYDTFLDIVFLKGVIDIALKRRARWGNEPPRQAAHHGRHVLEKQKPVRLSRGARQ